MPAILLSLPQNTILYSSVDRPIRAYIFRSLDRVKLEKALRRGRRERSAGVAGRARRPAGCRPRDTAPPEHRLSGDLGRLSGLAPMSPLPQRVVACQPALRIPQQ